MVTESGKLARNFAELSVDGDFMWSYRGISFNSGDIERVGIFVRESGNTTALDEIRLFETLNATELTDKLTGKAELPVDKSETKPGDGDTDDPQNSETENSHTYESDIHESDDPDSVNDNSSQNSNKIKRVVKVPKNVPNESNMIWWIVGSAVVAIVVIVGVGAAVFVVKKKKINR